MGTILVIEDEPQVRANLQEILELADYTTLGAANGKVGLDLAIQQPPDLIICDIMMPELDGYGVLHQLRQTAATANVPFIFLTAKSDRDDFRTGMRLGADDYLNKPFSPEEVLEAVAVRLERHQTLIGRFTSRLAQAQEAVQFLTNYSSVTGLPNYALLEKQFELSKLEHPNPDHKLVLMVLQVGHMADISATLGHRFRTCLLESLALRLLEYTNVPPSSGSGVAPIAGQHSLFQSITDLGGGQFGLLSYPVETAAAVLPLLEPLLDHLRQPFCISGREIFIQPRLGGACYPDHSHDLAALVSQAESALVEGSRRSHQTCHFYTPQNHQQALERLTLESKLHHAIEHQEFHLFYQPQFELGQGRLIGAEALIRWTTAEGRQISPMTFIPLAERTDLILPIGRWVLETACAQAQQWRQQLGEEFKISVNLSTRQLHQPELPQHIGHLLAETGLAPESLVLEITESSVLEDLQRALASIHSLKLLGIQMAIDDFGTGYSSLGCLRQLPFDLLKVDQSFVRDIHKTPDKMPITRVIIQLAHELGLEVVAEGIETASELDFLMAHGCHLGQGYLLGRPMAPEDFTRLVAAAKP